MRLPSFLGLLAVSAFVYGQSGAVAEYPSTTTKKTLYAKQDLRGKKAPSLLAQTWLTGAAPDLKGKVLVLDFWATWCPPCRATIPELNEIAKRFPKDVVVVGLSDENAETVRTFMKTTPMNYNVAVDPAKRTSNVLGVQGIPHVLVVTPDGIVRWQGFPLDETERLTPEVVGQIVAASRKKA